MPIFLFVPAPPPIDFWLLPDFIFDESYELNIAWDLFSDPDGYIGESYEFVDSWAGVPDDPNPAPDFSLSEYVENESYEFDGSWAGVPDDPNPSVDFSFSEYVENESYELDGYWTDGYVPLLPVPDSRMWFDAQDSSTLILVGGTDVSDWINKGEIGNFIQTTALNRPTLTTISSRQFVNFDGVNDYMTMTTIANNTAITFKGLHAFLVFSVTAINTNNATTVLNDALLADASTRWGMFLRHTANRVLFYHHGGSGTQTSTNISTSTVHLMEFYHDSTGMGASIDGGSFTTSTTGDTTFITGNLRLGSDYDFTNKLDGQIGELIFYSSRLSLADAQRNTDYLKNKWGI